MQTTTPQATRISQVVHRLYQQDSQRPLDDRVSLVGGQMGYALFDAYYEGHFGLSHSDHFWQRLSASLAEVQAGSIGTSFADGIAGVAWGFLHLKKQGFLQELDAQSIVEDLDEGLFIVSRQQLQTGNFDYLHQGLGNCLYFLERTPSAQLTHYLEQLVEQLGLIAVYAPNGDVTWRFLNFNQFTLDTAPGYNLSLSHGTASIVAILSLLYTQGYARARCYQLITGTLQWMWRVRNQAGHSVFPNIVTDSPLDQNSRLGWCYGDMGIASAYWLAGEALGNQTWKEIAQQTMLRTVPRRGQESLVRDAGLCHGSAGVAYLFRRFAQRTSDARLAQAADYWLDKTLAYVQSTEQEHVFLSYSGETGAYGPSPSLLDGETGIGLMLLTELGAPVAWERFLLLS